MNFVLNARGLGGDESDTGKYMGVALVLFSIALIVGGSWYYNANKDDPTSNDKTFAIVMIAIGIFILIGASVALYFAYKK